ncbi:MAG: hypothetical protein AUG49_20605 [Catenulispora sp. 13_1_20CM_3_70_7]|nr:MAG: hypothetical protein AUG49_20605 [Catenulispora sp. 13_1_20CM_3_70_7]
MDKLRRLGLRARGDIPTAAWLILLAVFVTEYWWWHSRVKLWDGDALYYVAAALKFAGRSTDEALRQTGIFFHQETTVDRIRGTLTGVAGQPGAGAHNLEAPRFFYSFLAVPFIWVFGAKGIWVLSLLCALAFLYVTMRLLTRLFGVQLALALLALYQIAYAFWYFQTGIYTESLAALLIVLILTRLPLNRTTTRNDLICIGFLVVVLAFTRQSVPVPVAAIVFAWLWTAIGTRQWGRANEWARPALVAAGVGLLAMAVVAVPRQDPRPGRGPVRARIPRRVRRRPRSAGAVAADRGRHRVAIPDRLRRAGRRVGPGLRVPERAGCHRAHLAALLRADVPHGPDARRGLLAVARLGTQDSPIPARSRNRRV